MPWPFTTILKVNTIKKTEVIFHICAQQVIQSGNAIETTRYSSLTVRNFEP